MSDVTRNDGVATQRRIPARAASGLVNDGNPIDQILVREQVVEVIMDETGGYQITLDSGTLVPVLPAATAPSPNGLTLSLPDDLYAALPAVPDLRGGAWSGGDDGLCDPEDVRRSLEDAFRFVADDPARNRQGLRSPQLGATHTVLGYWSTKKAEPATVVMPTGTGKTETNQSSISVGSKTGSSGQTLPKG